MALRFETGPSPEVLAYLKNKGWKPAFSYKDVWGEEHAFAFTVAKAMEMDVLRTIREALEKALEEGVPFARFQAELEPRLRDLGWWGVREMTDPRTGEILEAQLGSPRRLRTIYWANTRSARVAGQWDRAERTKAALPYFLYELGPSERHRPAHAAKAGLILRVDDPFWDHWMPQNGWGCKCRVRQIGEAEARRRGGVGNAPFVPMRAWRNSRTGEVLQVPEGIDPAWDTNPGKHRRRNLDAALAGKIRELPDDLADVAIRDMKASGRYDGALTLLSDPPPR
ncbi:MAG: phage minor head protein [Rhodospirillaceae bacterium]